ncbi:HAD family hydrolase [Pseudoramibacter sp.]|jgi:Cof subfamily protein (haloacid dehalogenase superfamily)|uniref:HAD family hydrolase n=1 Tax=Pseudoramibacter sp. TaxID=2034862 RepID=UPI0025CE9EC0|nr:HAD family hydrolase [Pseudoramibacter sp.]MCH4072965.1 Cof-type HAD-IIB family hydrolase [Pseudoramibacter sp.]MCH4106736.1 Cof-type HAD-IIB family hydrolase [Pseudoramibacter sp.]
MEQKRTIKLLALDLDNTLLTSKKTISCQSKQALKACEKAGIRVITASGRLYRSQINFTSQLSQHIQNNWHVCNGGGGLYCGQELMWRTKGFAPELFLRIINKIRQTPLFYFVDTVSEVFYEKDLRIQPSQTAEKLLQQTYIRPVNNAEEISHPVRIVFYCRNGWEVSLAHEIQEEGARSYDAGDKVVEIAPKALNKFEALKEVCRHYHIPMDQVTAVGDDENDLEMIQEAGLGIAMQNGTSKIKEAADIVGQYDNDHEGVSNIIKHYIL